MIRKIEETQKVRDKLPGGKEAIYDREEVPRAILSADTKVKKKNMKKRP
jgi:hypothetical protein